MKKKMLTKHHVIPKSRNGKSGLENISYLPKKTHQNYHNLFSNKHPEEIVEYLVKDCWNGQWDFVKRAYERNNKI